MTAPDATFSDVSSPLTPPAAATPADDRAAAVRSVAARRSAPRRSSTRPAGRAPREKTARKPAPKPAAAPKGKAESPGDKIAGWVATGAAVWFTRSPVRASILLTQAARLGPVLDDIAAENEQVARILIKIASIGSAGGAWAGGVTWAGQTAAAMVLAGGAVPAGVPGMLIAGLGGALLDVALADATYRIAEIRAKAEGRIDPTTGNITISPAELEAIRDELIASMRPPAPDGEDEDGEA